MRKRDIISVIIILIAMAMVLLGVHLAKEDRESDKKPTNIWLCSMLEK